MADNVSRLGIGASMNGPSPTNHSNNSNSVSSTNSQGYHQLSVTSKLYVEKKQI